MLIAEDDEPLRFLIRRVLEKAGFQVLVAGDGVAVVEVFRAHAERISLVILDMSMPRRGGLDALAEIRQTTPDMRALMISGYSDAIASGAMSGPDAPSFLPKPFENDELVRAVQRALAT